MSTGDYLAPTDALTDALARYTPDARVTLCSDKVEMAIAYAEILAITSPADSATADAVLTQVHETLKALDELYEEAKRPAYDEYVRIRDLFDTYRKPLAKAKLTIRDKRGAYLAEVESKRLAALESARCAVQAGDHAGVVQALEVNSAMAVVDTQGLKTAYTYTITDPTPVTGVAAEWLCPDEKRMSAAARALKPTDTPPDMGPGVVWAKTAKVNAKPERKPRA